MVQIYGDELNGVPLCTLGTWLGRVQSPGYYALGTCFVSLRNDNAAKPEILAKSHAATTDPSATMGS